MKLIFTFFILSVFVSYASHSQEDTCFFKPVLTSNCKMNSQTPGTTIVFQCSAGRTNTATEPLLVIDGVPYEFNELKNVNPNDVASIDILKDGASTAIHSCRPVRPVIIITTKTSYPKKFTVKDFLSGEKIPAATIRFTTGNDTINAVADKEGDLKTDKLKAGTLYEITVSCAGYRTLKTMVIGKEQEILLEKDIKTCSEVVVIAHPRIFDGCGTILKMNRSGMAKAVMNNNIAIPSVYPNPVKRNNRVHLDFNNDLEETMQLSILGSDGRLVLLQSEKVFQGYNHLSMNIEIKWSAGVYFIRLKDHRGNLVKQEKLIVQ